MRMSGAGKLWEKRTPAFSVMISTATVITVFLLAMWAINVPTERGAGVVTSVVESMTEAAPDQQPAEVESSVGVAELDTSDETPRKSESKETPDESSVVVKKEESESVSGVDRDETRTPATADKESAVEKQESVPEEELEEKAPAATQEEVATKESTVKAEHVAEKGPEETEETEEAEETVRLGEEEAPSDDKAELLVEKDEAATSSLITQGKESKEEKLQDVIQRAGKVKEEDVVDQSKEAEPETETEEEKAKKLGGLERVEVTDEGNYSWKVCSWPDAQDYIPCLDNQAAIKKLTSRKRFEHRERHCPLGNDLPTCLVPLPDDYKVRIDWPDSRDRVWHANVPHDKLVSYKKDQNWVQKKGDYLVFPGGGTQFKRGALSYIESISETWKDIIWGENVRTLLDVGCGVASFGGYLFEKDVIAMSFAPKDEHEAQVQMALERGIPALLSVMGTQRLVFPSNSFDVVHCARCRVHWEGDHGRLLLELNRILRPGGYFVWSATPVYKLKAAEDVAQWKATKKVTDSMCWKLLKRTKADPVTLIGIAVFQKPEDNACYDARPVDKPPMCAVDDKADAAWYVDMNSCMHRIPSGEDERTAAWPANWPDRVKSTPRWLKSIPKGIYGKSAFEEFPEDTEHWERVVLKSYFKVPGMKWKHIRNVMDMRAGYGGFAAALISQPVWVMNVIPIDEPDTLPIVYDRGLFGVYHDWCESFSTYPRTYDLVHADHAFASLKKRCGILNTLIEVDRIVRPNGWAIFRDPVDIIIEIEEVMKSLHWNITYTYDKGSQRLTVAQKGKWRPEAIGES